MVIQSQAITRIFRSPRWRANSTRAVIFPDATEAEGLVGLPRQAKRCRLLLETYPRTPIADPSNRRREACHAWAAPALLLLGAFPREDDVFLYLAALHWNAYSAGR
jgi:hypothetical protein